MVLGVVWPFKSAFSHVPRRFFTTVVGIFQFGPASKLGVPRESVEANLVLVFLPRSWRSIKSLGRKFWGIGGSSYEDDASATELKLKITLTISPMVL